MSTAWKDCCSCISQRWLCVIMTFFGLFCMYSIRVCISLAITEMSVHKPSRLIGDTCPPSEEIFSTNTTRDLSRQNKVQLYEWTEETQGIILASFFIGYVLTHIPGGMVAERFGGKFTLGFGILLNAIFTLLTPVAVHYGGATGLIMLRALVGAAQGVSYPSLNVILSQWTPIEERSKAGSLVYTGAPVGTVFATVVSGLILQYAEGGWPLVFYFFGAINIMWCLFWCILCYDSPEKHPFISEAELKFLHERLSSHRHQKAPIVPWRYVLKSVPVWALVAAMFGHCYGFLTLVTDLPKYMSNVLNFSVEKNGYLSSLPYVCMMLGSFLTSYISDWLIAKKYMRIGGVRKLMNSIASIGPAIFMIAASYAGCDKMTVVAMIALGMAFMGAALPSMKVNGLDLSPNYAGSLLALTNGIGTSSGAIAPIVVSILAPNQTMLEWRQVFWTIFFVFVLTNFIFVIYGEGEVQSWNDPDFLRKDKLDKKTRKTKEAVELLDAKA